MSLAEKTFENLAHLDGVIVGVESGMVGDDQLIEWLVGMDQEDFAILRSSLDNKSMKDLGEMLDADLMDEDLEFAYEAMKKAIGKDSKLTIEHIQKLNPETRHRLARAVAEAGHLRKAKSLSDRTKMKISKHMSSHGLG